MLREPRLRDGQPSPSSLDASGAPEDGSGPEGLMKLVLDLIGSLVNLIGQVL